jgi:hypothetical protein
VPRRVFKTRIAGASASGLSATAAARAWQHRAMAERATQDGRLVLDQRTLSDAEADLGLRVAGTATG